MRLFIALAVLCSTAALAEPDAQLEAVLQELGQKLATQKQMLANVDVTITGKQEELDKKGNVEHVTETVVKTTHQDGHATREIVKATQDGNDITDTMRKQVSHDEKNNSGDDARAENPFETALQPHYRFSRVPEAGPAWKVHFEPKDGGPTRMVGDAWIDPATADLVRLTAVPLEKPSHMDKAQLTEEFATQSPWGKLRSKLTMEAEGSILWMFHHRVRGTAQFSYALPK
jgi:hypothetical protein